MSFGCFGGVKDLESQKGLEAVDSNAVIARLNMDQSKCTKTKNTLGRRQMNKLYKRFLRFVYDLITGIILFYVCNQERNEIL